MWLIAWRSRLYSLCLILIIVSSYLIIINPVQVDDYQSNSIYLLEGWAVSQTIEHRAGPVSWSSQACPLSFTEIKILTICSWLTIAAWALFAFYLSVDLLPNSGPTWKWLALLLSSHMLVAVVRRERTNWVALLQQQANRVLEVQQLMQLADLEYLQQAFSLDEPGTQAVTAKKDEVVSVPLQDQAQEEIIVLKKDEAASASLQDQAQEQIITVKKDEVASASLQDQAQEQIITAKKDEAASVSLQDQAQEQIITAKKDEAASVSLQAQEQIITAKKDEVASVSLQAQEQIITVKKDEVASVSLQDQAQEQIITVKKDEVACASLQDQAQEQIITTKKDEVASTICPSRMKQNQPKRTNSASKEMVDQLAKLVVDLPIGSNLGVFHFFWMMVTGQLLASRGAIFPALQAMGLQKEAVRRAWAAFNSKSWRIETLLATWQDQVITNDQWQERSYQGYRAKAVDLTAFWRPTVANCQTSHYDARAGRALPAVVLGVAARVGDINGQRVPLPTDFVRSDENNPSEKQLERKLIQKLKLMRAEDEIHIFDAGFDLSMLIELALNGWIIRLPKNFVGKRNQVKPYSGRGTRPKHGEEVRPLGRQSRTRWIEADPADESLTLKDGQVEIRVELWKDLIQNSDLPGAKSFNVMAFHDPRYKKPWLLATDVKELSAQSVRSLYKDRWPVEQLPLAAKQMIGAHRQFVWSDENIQRLPEISLLAGSILTHVAASLPPIPTGFWDRAPKATPGRLRRHLNLSSLERILANFPLPARVRKKESCTDHLKTGRTARKQVESAQGTT